MADSSTLASSLATLTTAGWLTSNPLRFKVCGIVGDSELGGGNATATVTAVIAAGVITFTWAGSPMFRGATFNIAGAAEDTINGTYTCTGSVGNNFTANAIGGGDGAVSGSLICTMDHRVNDRSAVNIANAAVGGYFDYVINRGISGTTSAQMLARWSRDVPRWGFEAIIIQSFTNDFRTCTTATAAAALATAKTNAIIAAGLCKSMGMVAIFGTVPTGSDATWTGDAARVPTALLFNEWLRRFCVANQKDGVYLLETWGALCDPASTTGVFRTAPAAYSNDFIHPNGFGAFKLGLALVPVFQQAFRIVPGRRCVSAADSVAITANLNQLNTNPLMSSGGATATGYAIANIGGGGNVPTIVARADGFGNNQHLVITAAGAGDGASFTGTSCHASVVAGDVLQLEVQLSLSAITALNNFEISLDFTLDGQAYFCRANSTNGQTPGWGDTFTDYVFRTVPFVMPSGALTVCRARLQATHTGAGGCTVDISRLGINRLVA